MNISFEKILFWALMLGSIILVLMTINGINKNYLFGLPEMELNTLEDESVEPQIETIIKKNKNLEDYKIILQKPLFSEDRKPFTPKPLESSKKLNTQLKNQKKSVDTARLRLNAVILSKDKKIALILDEKNNTLTKAHEGESINGWEIKKVDSHAAILGKGGNEILLELEIKSNFPSMQQKNIDNTNSKMKDNMNPAVMLDEKESNKNSTKK